MLGSQSHVRVSWMVWCFRSAVLVDCSQRPRWKDRHWRWVMEQRRAGKAMDYIAEKNEKLGKHGCLYMAKCPFHGWFIDHSSLWIRERNFTEFMKTMWRSMDATPSWKIKVLSASHRKRIDCSQLQQCCRHRRGRSKEQRRPSARKRLQSTSISMPSVAASSTAGDVNDRSWSLHEDDCSQRAG